MRAETPGVSGLNHLNNAGASLQPQSVLDAVVGHLRREAEIGGYEAADEVAPRLAATYDAIAQLIGAEAEEIAFVSNATVAWQAAFYALRLAEGDEILTAEAEYAANFVAYLQRQRRGGVVVRVVPSDGTGAVDVAALEGMITSKTRLIAITWVPTNGGLVNPAEAIGAVARAHGIPFLLDACQAVGQMPVDVAALGCDFLAATGRKFLRGPRGTGFLYVARRWLSRLEPAMIDHFGAPWVTSDAYELRPDARRFETWERAIALQLGLGEAARYAMACGVPALKVRSWGLAERARDGLRDIGDINVRDLGGERSAIVTFDTEAVEAQAIKQAMREQRINVSVSWPSSTRIDSERRALPPLVRLSPHAYNTEDEIDAAIGAIGRLVRKR